MAPRPSAHSKPPLSPVSPALTGGDLARHCWRWFQSTLCLRVGFFCRFLWQLAHERGVAPNKIASTVSDTLIYWVRGWGAKAGSVAYWVELPDRDMAKNRQLYNQIVNEVCVAAGPLRFSLYRHKCKCFRWTAWYSAPPNALFVAFCSTEMVNTKLVFVVTPRAGSVWLLAIIIYQNQALFLAKKKKVCYPDLCSRLIVTEVCCVLNYQEPLMSDHTFASISGTNGRAEGILHVRIPHVLARGAGLWVWRSDCRLSDSICPHSCRSVGASVSQPSDMPGAEATCFFEYLQFGVLLKEEGASCASPA